MNQDRASHRDPTPQPSDAESPSANCLSADASLEKLLREADPAAAPLDAERLRRLQQFWAATTISTASEPVAAVDAIQPAEGAGRGWSSWPVWVVGLVTAACLLLIAGRAVMFPPAKSPELKIASQLTPAVPSDRRGSAVSEPDPGADRELQRRPVESGADEPRRIATIRQLRERLKRRLGVDWMPMLLANDLGDAGDRRRKLPPVDFVALREELANWLSDWSLASPDDRMTLEATWNENREFWLVWTAEWCGTFASAEINRAAIDALVADQGAACEEILWKAIGDAELRSRAWSHLCRLLPDQRLGLLMERVETRDELQTVAAALIVRASPAATEMLAQIAARAECREVLAGLTIEWPDVHAQRCQTSLVVADPQAKLLAAGLLVAIPGSDVDDWLRAQVVAGRHRVDAMSVLLLRSALAKKEPVGGAMGGGAGTQDSGANGIDQVVGQLPKSPEVLANLPSAVQQVARWNHQFNWRFSPQWKACLLCDVSS